MIKVCIYISEIIRTSGGSQIRTSEGSQFRTSGGSQSFSDKFKISSCCPNDSMLSSIDINNIAMSHTPNGSTQNQCQSLSVPLAQQSVNGTYSSADLDTPYLQHHLCHSLLPFPLLLFFPCQCCLLNPVLSCLTVDLVVLDWTRCVQLFFVC